MTNHWNRIVYFLWVPIYDSTINRVFLPGRCRAFACLDLSAGSNPRADGCAMTL